MVCMNVPLCVCLVSFLAASKTASAFADEEQVVMPSSAEVSIVDAEDGDTDVLNMLQTKMAVISSQHSPSGQAKNGTQATEGGAQGAFFGTQDAKFREFSGGDSNDMFNKLQVRFVKNPDMSKIPEGPMTTGTMRRSYSRPAFKIVTRVIWQKTFRCTGPTQDTCEVCSADEQNCWSDCESTRCVKPTGADKATRFLSAIHVQCSSPSVALGIQVDSLRGGSLKLYWDEQLLPTNRVYAHTMKFKNWPNPLTEQAFGKIRSVYRGNQVWIHVKNNANPGGHTFTMEFATDSSRSVTSPEIQIGWLTLMENPGFETCMDTKMCLNILDKHGTEGKALRASNLLLLQCITASLDQAADLQKVGPACGALRKCLDPAHTNHLVSLLHAAIEFDRWVEGWTPSTPTASPPTKLSTSDMCLNPSEEDPMSWECDCYDEMKKRCTEMKAVDEKTCLRAQMCMHEHICPEWASRMCNSPAIETMKQSLNAAKSLVNAQQLAFAARASASAKEEATDLEHSAGRKACQ
eukprot:gnl/TRDRNA2_/TRDRNA2_159140_c0_seq12.p1 gnl/TRDRNA2_/TRDRNA2_159140_c0~~gnl/TRDRNA2_/TRDRNA2_159140_c0_seq12.p1  ORF type:complete len:520 (+),score=55.33 gnl/TRDRNA2_/TRDRNA2_159140_c0_seq12:114-1673(+)